MRWTTAALALGMASAAAHGADWPEWRGPNRDGVSAESGLLASWPEGGPPLLWEARGLGAGFSSCAVSGGKVFTQGQSGGRQFVVALEEESGRILWRKPYGEAFHERRGGGPRGTPTVDGDRLYALSSNGDLLCARTSDGKRLWSTRLLERFGARNIRWGISESPLVDGRRVIVTPGGRQASVAALDKNNGNLIWKAPGDRAGYSSPMVAEIGGIRHYVVLTGGGAVGVRASDGEVLWRYDKVSNSTANVATPIVRGNHVFLSTDYGTGCALLRLEPEGTGIRAVEVYFHRGMKNHYGSSVLLGEYLYGFSSRILTSMHFLSGEVQWRDRSVGKGQIVTAQGLLYILSDDGVAGLVKADPEGYDEISRFSIQHGPLRTWTLPVVAGGKLFLRDQDTLFCYDIKAGE